MRKLALLLISAIIFCFGTTSCNRNYTCSCDYNINDTLRGYDNNDIHGSKNHVLHECCTIRKAQLETAGYKNVRCAVPI